MSPPARQHRPKVAAGGLFSVCGIFPNTEIVTPVSLLRMGFSR